jgi:hypothetical protein
LKGALGAAFGGWALPKKLLEGPENIGILKLHSVLPILGATAMPLSDKLQALREKIRKSENTLMQTVSFLKSLNLAACIGNGSSGTKNQHGQPWSLSKSHSLLHEELHRQSGAMHRSIGVIKHCSS